MPGSCVQTLVEQEAANMNIFEYFAEEEADIERNLAAVTENYEAWSREKVFDSVKAICDSIMAHLKKQSTLIVQNFNTTGPLQDLFTEAQRDHNKVEDELGQLTQVHVDEPNYDEYLKNLLKVIDEHIVFSRRFYGELQRRASKQELDNLNAQFNNIILHSVDFNTIQTQ